MEGPSQHPVKRGRLDWAGSGLAVYGLGTSFPWSRPQPGEAEVVAGGQPSLLYFEYLYFRKQLVDLREGERETCERSLRPCWRPAF